MLPLFWCVTVMSCLFVIFRFYYVPIANTNSSWYMLLLTSFMLSVVFLFSWSILHAWVSRKRGLLFAFIPLVAFIFGFLIPSGRLANKWEFDKYRDDRETVVELIRNGTLRVSEDSYTVTLPEKFRHVSLTGQVYVRGEGAELEVYFIRLRTFPMQESGYVHSTSGRLLEDPWSIFRFDPRLVTENWYRGGRG